MENTPINGTIPEVEPTTPPEPPKKFCKHCGERIDIDCVVCPKCGKQVEVLRQEAPQVVVNNNNVNTNTNVNRMSSGLGYYPYKSKAVALILAIFFGFLGVHRFYVEKIGTGVIWLFTFGCFGIGWIVDIVTILIGGFRDKARMPLR